MLQPSILALTKDQKTQNIYYYYLHIGVVATIDESNNNHELSVSRCDYGSLKEMPKAVLNLIKNKTYMCISIGAALDAFLLAGKTTFPQMLFCLQVRASS